MARGDLTAAEWAVIGCLLPPERGRKARPAHDKRLFLNGMLYVLRVGCPWRDMHERYGKWNSVYVRFRRWAEQGVWDARLDTLVDLGLTDDWRHMIDSTAVRGHSQAAGSKGESERKRPPFVSQPPMTTSCAGRHFDFSHASRRGSPAS